MAVFIFNYFDGFYTTVFQLCPLTMSFNDLMKARSKLDHHYDFLNEFSSFLISVMDNFGPCTYVLVLYRQLIFTGIF